MRAPLLDEPHGGVALPAKAARWSIAKAYRILAFCTLLQLLIYADRGIVAGLLDYVEVKFSIDKVQSGLLGTIFLAGFMLMSPVAAAVSNQGEAAWRVIGRGLLVWGLSAAGCALARSYGVLLLARATAGCGEAALCSLAPPLIDDAAPPRQKSAFLAVYFSAIFMGLGVGFAVAGFASSWSDGQKIFGAEAITMAPLCAIALFCSSCLHVAKAPASSYLDLTRSPSTVAPEAPEEGSFNSKTSEPWPSSFTASLSSVGSCQPGRVQRTTSFDAFAGACSLQTSASQLQLSVRDDALGKNAGKSEADKSGRQELKAWWKRTAGNTGAVLQSSVYTLLVLGYCATIFTIGGIAFWAPSYMGEVLGADPRSANRILGVITGLTGLCGTTVGGLLLDILDGVYGRRRLQAVRLCLVLVALACPVTMVTAAAQSRAVFFWSLALGQLLIFASTAPANIAMMEAVSPDQRGLALGLCTLASHLLGDLIPPVLVGYIADATGSLSGGMWLLVLWLLWSVLFWSLATFQTGREVAKEAQKL